jgi:hypothetical protein
VFALSQAAARLRRPLGFCRAFRRREPDPVNLPFATAAVGAPGRYIILATDGAVTPFNNAPPHWFATLLPAASEIMMEWYLCLPGLVAISVLP